MTKKIVKKANHFVSFKFSAFPLLDITFVFGSATCFDSSLKINKSNAKKGFSPMIGWLY